MAEEDHRKSLRRCRCRAIRIILQQQKKKSQKSEKNNQDDLTVDRHARTEQISHELQAKQVMTRVQSAHLAPVRVVSAAKGNSGKNASERASMAASLSRLLRAVEESVSGCNCGTRGQSEAVKAE